MAYPRKWSPISYRSSAGQRKYAGQRPTFYRWTTQPTNHPTYKGRLLQSERRAGVVTPRGDCWHSVEKQQMIMSLME